MRLFLLLIVCMLLIAVAGCAERNKRYQHRQIAIRGAETYVTVSGDAMTKIDLAQKFIRVFAEPYIIEQLDITDLYFTDAFYAPEELNWPDGVALPLGSRIVFLREFVEDCDLIVIAILYVHELHHMSQGIEICSTAEAEDDAQQAEQRFREASHLNGDES